jgi:hypothetical protein
MLDLIIVRVIFLDGDLDPFLHIIHVPVEVGNVLDISDRLWDVQRLLFVDDLLYLLHC